MGEALGLQPNGYLIEEEGLFSPQSQSLVLSNPSPESISGECWEKAEETAREIIRQIQPTVVSERRRKEVTDHVQRLIRHRLGSEVFPFGSVPLKTFLPDGDIDLTALSMPAVEEVLAKDVCIVLEREEHNKDADFEVKDVQYVNAEVKLVKCLVRNIVIDISFNQTGGLATLCFLEQIDRLIGKNHLLKKSIILIKAWCYHESRILGAHHGLISTYALETMVLYIFHLFHSSLNGPIAVLYRFLDHYSKFDWDHFGISLNGPINLSLLPEIVVETPDNDGGELLLDKEFLRNCIEMFSVQTRSFDTNLRSFTQKHLNILDPLKDNNNLGRSVNKGNFYRIRSAFTYGARKLGQILLLTADDIREELNKFFLNTLERHGSGQRPDVQGYVPIARANRPDPASGLAVEKYTGDKSVLKPPSVDSNGTVRELQEGIHEIQLSRTHKKSCDSVVKEAQRCSTSSPLEVLEKLGYIKENGTSVCHLVCDADGNTISEIPNPMFTSGTSESISQSYEVTSPLSHAHHAHLYMQPPVREVGKIETRYPDEPKERSSPGNKMPSGELGRKDSEASMGGANGNIDLSEDGLNTVGNVDSTSSSVLDPIDASANTTGSTEAASSLSDLTGDYVTHMNNFCFAKWFHDCGFSTQFLPLPSQPFPFQNNHPFGSLHRPMHHPNVFLNTNANDVFQRPPPFPLHPPCPPVRSHGTGTYFPRNGRPCKERTSAGRGRLALPAPPAPPALPAPPAPPAPPIRAVRPLRDSNWGVRTPEMHFADKRIHPHSQEQYPPFPSRAMPLSPRFFQDNSHSRSSPQPNGLPLSDQVEFGSFGPLPSSVNPEACRQPASSTCSQGYSSNPTPVTTPRSRQSLDVDVEGSKLKTYHLKNEADFPPLAVPVSVVQSNK